MNEELHTLLNPILKRIPLFQGLSVRGYKNLLHCIEEKEVPADSYLFFENDKGDYLYIIRSGEVEIRKGLPSERISILKQYDYFGEMALLKDNVRNATAKTLTDCSFYIISQECFQKLIETDPEFTVLIGRSYVERARENWRNEMLKKQKRR